eukprot:1146550-Pelagomonas_calceolata.AAC.4
MARVAEASLCAYCTAWAWSFHASLGMGSIDSPTHTQENCVESGLGTLKLFAQFTGSCVVLEDCALIQIKIQGMFQKALLMLLICMRHGLLLVILLIPIDSSFTSLGEGDTWCLGPRHPLFLN